MTTTNLDPKVQATLSVAEFAQITGVCLSTAYAGIAAGDIPHFRVASRIRIPTAAVRRLLQLDEVGDAA